MRIVAVANQKGGCGKTTTSINLAAAFGLLQKKTLLIDLDPQGHSTCGLGIDVQKLAYTLYDLLSAPAGMRPSVREVTCQINPFLDVLPCYEILNALEEELFRASDREKRLKQLIKDCIYDYAYEYVILDCPPNLGVLTFNALEAADEVIVPIEPSFFSLHGLSKILETLNLANQQREKPLVLHALLNLFDSRTRFAKEVYEDVKNHLGPQLFKTIIHESVVLKEAAGSGQSVIDYDPQSTPCQEFINLALEFFERDWNRRLPEDKLGWENKMREKFGPRKVTDGILFQAPFKNAKQVEIAGDFNDWIPEAMHFEAGLGLWQKVVPLGRGQYRYKMIVDGQWQVDPCQSEQKANDFGTYDSYMEVKEVHVNTQ